MRPADIYRLHYESAFAGLNPGKPLVLPPSGFGSRVLPAPGPVPTPDIAAAVRQPTNTKYFDRDHPQPDVATPIIVEVTEPTGSAPMMTGGLHAGHEAYQRLRSAADRELDAPIEDAVSVEARDRRRDAKAAVEQPSTANVPPKSSTFARMRRFRFHRQTMLVAGALALGIGGTSVFFAHPDPHAITLAWQTYKAAIAAPPDRGAIAPRATMDNMPPASGTSTSNANPATQQNTANPVGAARWAASNPVVITIPHAPGGAPRALTSQDLMPNPQGSSPLGNVSPDALRRPMDLSVQNVAVEPTTTAPANVYESPIRKPLNALHHPAESNNEAEPVQVRPAHASEEANPKKNARPTAGDVATSAVGKTSAQSAQQVRQDTNGDQKLF